MLENLPVIGCVVAAYTVFATAYFALQRVRLGAPTFLLGLALVGQLLLVELDLGFASIRIFAVFLLMIYSLLQLPSDADAQHRLLQLHRIFFWTATFLLWLVVCDFSNGVVASVGGVTEYVFGFASSRLIPLFFLISIVILIRSAEHLRFVAALLSTIVVISAGFGALQFMDVEFAHRAHELLAPQTLQQFELKLERDLDYGDLAVGGLSGYSVDLSYQLISYGMFPLSFCVIAQRSRLPVMVAIAAVVVVAAGLLICKSRSGVTGLAICLCCAPLLSQRLFANARAKSIFVSILIGVLIVAGVGAFLLTVNSADGNAGNLSRMSNYTDEDRVRRAAAAVQSIAANPLLGQGIAEFVAEQGYSPHNTLLNAGLASGLPGIMFCLLFHWSIFSTLLGSARLQTASPTAWCTLGSLLGIIGYLWNGMFHNGSFVTGGIHIFVLFGVFYNSLLCDRYCSVARNLINTANGVQLSTFPRPRRPLVCQR